MSERELIDLGAALLRIPAGERVHTFRNPGVGMLLGADWDRDELVAAMTEAPEILVTGAQAQAVNHGLAISYNGSMLFIETVKSKAV